MERFSNARLIGTYAVANIGHGGQTPQAGVSVATYDGKGSFSGVTVQDVPGHTFTERVFVTVPFTGTYSVSESGEGAGSITTKMPDGSTHEVRIALVITKSAKKNGVTVAEKFAFMHEQLFP